MKSNNFFIIFVFVILFSCSNVDDNIYISSTYSILPDGTGYEIGELSFKNQSDSSLTNYIFGSTSDSSIVKLMDMNDNELEFSIEPDSEYFNYNVLFPYPIAPDQEIILKAFSPKQQFAKLKNGTWIFEDKRTFGPTIIYTPTIQLPKNSEVIYTNIKPIKEYIEYNSLILEFHKKVPKNEYFKLKIKYKFSAKK